MIKKAENKYSLQELFDNPDLYKNEVIGLKDDNYFELFFLSLRMSRYSPGLMIDLPISGELVFNCDHRIWQSLIFDKYIYDFQYQETKEISLKKVVRYLKYNQPYAIVNEEYANTDELIFNGEKVKVDLVYHVVKKYFEYLSLLRYVYVSNSGQIYSATVKLSSGFYNNDLFAFNCAIRNIDKYATNVDELIKSEIYKLEKEYIEKNYIIRGNDTVYVESFKRIVNVKNLLGMQDRYYNVWFKCKCCNEIKRDFEFSDTYNIFGVCKACSKLGRNLDIKKEALIYNPKKLKMPNKTFLMDTHIAGTKYINKIQILQANLKPGDKLLLFREPENPYDRNAILVKNCNKEKLGYIPKDDNTNLAAMMDEGRKVYAEIVRKKLHEKYVEICISVFLFRI